MGISRDKWHKRRASGGKRTTLRMKRKFELGRQPAMTRIGERRVHQVRCRGGYIKFRALKVDHGNYSWPGEAVTRKSRILAVLYNPTNPEYVRTNTIVKGTIVQVDATPFKNWYQKHYGVVLGKATPYQKENKTESKKTRRHRALPPEKPKKVKDLSNDKEKKQEKKEVKKVVPKPTATTTPTVVAEKPVVKKVCKINTRAKSPKSRGVVPTPKKEVSERKCKATNNSRGSKHRPSGAMMKKWKLRNATRVLEASLAEQFEKNRLYARISTSPGQCGSADGYILEGQELAFYVRKLQLKKKK